MACSSDPIERRSQKGAAILLCVSRALNSMPEVSVEAQQGSLEARARGPIFPSGRVLYSREGMEGAPARYRHRHLIAALNACMMVGYVVLCALARHRAGEV